MRVLVVLCLVLAAVGCQPAGGPPGGRATPSPSVSGRPLGAPAVGLPTSFEDLFTAAHAIAEEWQAEPVLVEAELDVVDGGWSDARLVYVAADADRYLQLIATGSGFSQERITLSTLQVEAIPAAAVEDIPAFPDDAADPATLVAQEAVTACGVADAASVFYVTGAPVSWDGEQWSPEPQWRVTVTSPEGEGAATDVTGGDVRCLQ